MKGSKNAMRATGLLCALLLVVAATGCPQLDPDQPDPDGKALLTTVFTGDGAPLANKILEALKPGPVAVEDIESLTVTITRIVLDLDKAEPAEEDPEEGEEEEKNNASKVVVFSGEMPVNVLDLSGVSQLISLEEVPAGRYTKIRLEIKDPELVLKADPETVVTNIHLTANARLFIGVDFELEDGANRILVLDFGGIHLVRTGHGGYVLTPQLRASLEILTVEDTFVRGVIASVDYEVNSFVLLVEGGEIAVTYTEETEIFLPTDDAETPTGTEADLVAGLEVYCFGALFSDNTMAAVRIEILPEEDPEEEDPEEEDPEEEDPEEEDPEEEDPDEEE